MGTSFKDIIGHPGFGLAGKGGTGIVGVLSNVVVPVIIALAFMVFVWGVLQYFFLHGSDEAKRSEGRQFMIWGIIGLAVIFSVWSIVWLLLQTLGIAPISTTVYG